MSRLSKLPAVSETKKGKMKLDERARSDGVRSSDYTSRSSEPDVPPALSRVRKIRSASDRINRIFDIKIRSKFCRNSRNIC